MSQATRGNTVKIHYQGTLADGTVFDSSEGRDPLEFTLGGGEVIPGFEQAVDGMSVGEKRTVTIPSDQAYGPYNDDLVHAVPRDAMPEDLDPQPGMALQARGPDGQVVMMTVLEVSADTVKVDGNHPLAGKDLTFALELVAVG